jgi:hypothetical protein
LKNISIFRFATWGSEALLFSPSPPPTTINSAWNWPNPPWKSRKTWVSFRFEFLLIWNVAK